MNRTLQINADGVDAEAVLLAHEARDAQLVACLAYLLVAAERTKDRLVTYSQVAVAYNVTTWTVARWLVKLERLELVAIRGENDGFAEVTVRPVKTLVLHPGVKKLADGFKGPWTTPAQDEVGSRRRVSASQEPQIAPAGQEGGGKLAAAPSKPDDPRPFRHVPKNLFPGPAALGVVANSRLEGAVECFRASRLADVARSIPEALAFLTQVVKNPLFDKLDLPREILDADAWLAARPKERRPDQAKYLSNWLRKSAAALKAPLRNVNVAPRAGKYDGLSARARGAR